MFPIKKLKGALRANKGYTPEGDGIKQGAKAHPKNFHVKVQEMSNVETRPRTRSTLYASSLQIFEF